MITSEYYVEVQSVRKSREFKYYVYLALSSLIQNLNVKFMFYRKMKAEDILHSLVTIDLSFTSELLT